MGAINLYKIDKNKICGFNVLLSEKMKLVAAETITKTFEEQQREFICSLYLSASSGEKTVSWNWLLRAFKQSPIRTQSQPRAVLVISCGKNVYAVTYGHAFFLVDKYCDRDFGFSFGRKLEYEEIKTTALTAPGLKRNKVVNTYIDYNELEFDSGESFAKLKAKEVLPDGFSLYKPTIEIGTSIRFVTENDSLETVIDLIVHVEKTATKPDVCKIPVFCKVADNDYIQKLEKKLKEDIKQGITTINISELDIIGVTEIFNNNDSTFQLRYGHHRKDVSDLNDNALLDFCKEKGIDYDSNVLDIRVVNFINGDQVGINTVHDIIDYTIDSEKCLLAKGVWYRYNDDYLAYLKDSLSEIDVEYHPEYDFIKGTYTERSFNEARAKGDGFENLDRKTTRVGSNTVEPMDLYKDKTMFAVKIGGASSKLCYVVDQSLTSLKLYKSEKLSQKYNIETVAVWIVLERKTKLEGIDGVPDINQLDMLMLKNRLDQWKKEVRLQGFRPLIYINYAG